MGVTVMSLLRTLAVIAVAGLATATAAQAAESSAFQVLVSNGDGSPVMFQSATALKKGDVIKIHAFNAPAVMVMQIAMCDSDCPRMHLVKTLQLFTYHAGSTDMNQQFVVPENGHVSFWVQQVGYAFSVPIARGWSVATLDRTAGFPTPVLFENSPPMSANAITLDDNTLRLRYYHKTFVAVSLADASI
jgi:hypothetical protein